ncbi:DUF2231 domain-containing protein [Pseudonocardia sp. GCM10023141]|uniref:DUF2231 domain-containing protein n=1 Tax=Pseudonocardia sp. GCM10023141 TaxID=3252653 RepID=UPI003608695A
MPTFINDLPLHVLVVHAVVVLVPLAVLGAVTVAVWPAARRRYGWLVVAVTAVATVAIPVATSSGEGLEHRLPRTALLEAHTRLGDDLLVFVAGLLVALTAFVVLHHRATVVGRRIQPADHGGPGTAARTAAGPPRVLAGVLAAVTVALAVVAAVQVYRIGDSGARAAWADTHYVTTGTGRSSG